MPGIQVNIPDEFSCPITQDVMISPVRTNCPAPLNNRNFQGHVFEKLALANWFRQPRMQARNCPVCRKHITQVVPDTQLARKIQNEFVNVTQANKEYFERTKQELNNDYRHLINQRVIPQTFQRFISSLPFQRVPQFNIVSEELAIQNMLLSLFSEQNNTPPSTDTTNRSSSSFRDRIKTFVRNALNKVERFFKNLFPRPKTSFELYSEVDRLVYNGDLLQAQRVALQITEPEWKNLSFQEITNAYIRLRPFNLDNLEEAQKNAELISDASMKNDLLSYIAKGFLKIENYRKALQATSKINHFWTRMKLYSLLPIFYILNTLRAYCRRRIFSS